MFVVEYKVMKYLLVARFDHIFIINILSSVVYNTFNYNIS